MAAAGGGRVTLDDVLARRRVVMPGMRLAYREPLRIVSGEGVWLTDAGGDRYLDAYNNVAHVGHGRPEVVEAIARQAAVLNTNTRYLVDGVVAYAERIARLLPDPLEVVWFANSGSEANDLAWRIARAVTGREGMIVTRNAYHGSTHLTMATSPEELGHDRLPPWVATIGPPVAGSEPGVEAAVARLAAAGHLPAALACDTVFSSDGIFEPPAGWLAAAAGEVRTAGGLFVADEVQAGFGRVGPRLWGFAGHGVVPDIVTLGKPMGNGHPLAAVVTTRRIADAFRADGYYFSTFAGNPVSAAAGMAVLDVMEGDGLPARASRVGALLHRELAGRHPSIREVRGPGSFVGVDLGTGRLAQEVMEGMRARRVLVGRTGGGGEVLKIRPPLVFGEEHAGLLLAAFDGALGDQTSGSGSSSSV
ncbi:MAG: aminotransferase class III-fold pyridoxal phosphate-dependent enzyme [Actinobacteria bacterium]|nr:aminotransferase class III-fold pyridoxal phosphate-dependent enzyme [Actinomycetota bacterium]